MQSVVNEPLTAARATPLVGVRGTAAVDGHITSLTGQISQITQSCFAYNTVLYTYHIYLKVFSAVCSCLRAVRAVDRRLIRDTAVQQATPTNGTHPTETVLNVCYISIARRSSSPNHRNSIDVLAGIIYRVDCVVSMYRIRLPKIPDINILLVSGIIQRTPTEITPVRSTPPVVSEKRLLNVSDSRYRYAKVEH